MVYGNNKENRKTIRPRRFVSFLNELKERKVLRVAVAYFVVTWIVIQVGDSTFEALNMPNWAGTLLVVFIMFGFPFALLLAWAYELTPDGIVKDPDGSASHHPRSMRPGSENSRDNVEDSPPSIAVLQFEDMSPERDQAYFCEGIAEEILCALNEVDGLKVAARLASFQFDSKSADVLEIGRKLNVSVVLEGSVRKAGDKVRITIQLINARTGYQFWAGQYNHDLKDVFEIQEQMARAVVKAMRLSIGKSNLTRRPMTQSSEAYDLYLKARSYFNRPDKHSILIAQKFYRQAIEIDSDFGRAWAKLALTYVYQYLCIDPNGNARSEARRISNIALSVAPEIAVSHIASGITYTIYKDYKHADLAFQNAINLNPDSFGAWFTWARSKTYQGDYRKAVELYQKASEINPQNYLSVLMQARLLNESGEHLAATAKAKEGLLKAKEYLELVPDEYRALNMGAFALHTLGRLAEAKEWMMASIQISPRNSILNFSAASFYAMTGDIEKSLNYLGQAADNGCFNPDWLAQDAGLKKVMDDPRFKRLNDKFKGGCACGCSNPICL